MDRKIGPDEGSRKVELIVNDIFRARRNRPVTIFLDSAATILADILTLDGALIAGSVVYTDAYSMLQLFQFPLGVDTVYGSSDGGPVWPIYARTDDRLDAVEATANAAEATAGAAETPAGAQTKASAAQAAAIAASAQRTANLADLSNVGTARTNLGLGNAATRAVGTTAGTVADGADSRLTNTRTPTAHATAHQPGGTDPLAVDAVAGVGSLRSLGTGAQQAAPGNDARFGVEAMPVSSGLSWTGAVDLTSLAATARTILATMTGNVTLTLPTPSPSASFTVTLVLAQDVTGSRTLTLPASVLAAYGVDPVLSTTPGVTDLVHLLWTGAAWVALMAAPAVA